MPTNHLLYHDLPTPDEIRLWDNETINGFGYPASMLMETASRETLRVLQESCCLTHDSSILIYAGRGNNGGDGIALGRHLHELGYSVALLAVGPLEDLPSPAREHWAMAQKSALPCFTLSEDSPGFLPPGFGNPSIIVDAIMGTGLNKPLSPFLQTVIAHINNFTRNTTILAVDIPSGLNGLSGLPMPVAVKAHMTVSFEALKPGLALPHAQEYVGKAIARSIGIPKKIKEQHPPSWQLLSPQDKPFITFVPDLHKGTAGKILVIGGSDSMEGAPGLSALGALRTGGGYVKVLCPANMARSLQRMEAGFLVQGVGTSGTWQQAYTEQVLETITSFSPHAIIMGMGMGRTSDCAQVVAAVLAMPERCPVVLDADALFILSQEKQYGVSLLEHVTDRDIITPHPLEAVRLLPNEFFGSSQLTEPEKIVFLQGHRPQACRELAEITPGPVVLKGAGTLITQRNQPIILAPFDVPALAVAGSGDVLAGVIGGLVAKKELQAIFQPIDMASFGVYLHALAGIHLSAIKPVGNLPAEIAHSIPVVLSHHLAKRSEYHVPCLRP